MFKSNSAKRLEEDTYLRSRINQILRNKIRVHNMYGGGRRIAGSRLIGGRKIAGSRLIGGRKIAGSRLIGGRKGQSAWIDAIRYYGNMKLAKQFYDPITKTFEKNPQYKKTGGRLIGGVKRSKSSNIANRYLKKGGRRPKDIPACSEYPGRKRKCSTWNKCVAKYGFSEGKNKYNKMNKSCNGLESMPCTPCVCERDIPRIEEEKFVPQIEEEQIIYPEDIVSTYNPDEGPFVEEILEENEQEMTLPQTEKEIYQYLIDEGWSKKDIDDIVEFSKQYLSESGATLYR